MSIVSEQVIQNYEAEVAHLTERVGSLAADLLEEQAQRREVGEALVRVTEERDRLADENLAVHTDLAEELHTVDDLRAQLDDAQATASMRTGQLMASRVLLDEAQTSAAEHSRRHAEIFDEHLRQVAQLTDERDEARQQREAATWLHAQAMELIGEVEAERDEAREKLPAWIRAHGQVATERDEERAERDQLVVVLGQANDTAAGLLNRIDELLAERDEAQDEVVRLGREREQLMAGVAEAARQLGETRVKVDRLDQMIAEYTASTEAELVRLRTIIVELGAGEAAEPEIDVSGSLRMSVAEQIGCPSCHTILNARAAGGCGDTWHWENRQQPEEQIEALRPEGER